MEAYAGIVRFTQPSNKFPTEQAEALWNKAFRFDRIYDEFVLKIILSKNYWSESEIGLIYTGALQRTLKYMIRRAMQLRWRSYNIVCTTLMHLVPTTREISNVEILDEEAENLEILVRIRRRRLVNLAKCVVLSVPGNCNADMAPAAAMGLKMVSHHHQRSLSTMHSSPISVWLTTN